MLKQLSKNKQGVVLITVLMIIVVMMVLTISVISLNVSQVTFSDTEIKRIQAQSLAMGGLAYIYGWKNNGNPSSSISYDILLGNSTFTINAGVGPEAPVNGMGISVNEVLIRVR